MSDQVMINLFGYAGHDQEPMLKKLNIYENALNWNKSDRCSNSTFLCCEFARSSMFKL